MKRLPTDDDCYGVGSIREDGRKLHPTYFFASSRSRRARGKGIYTS